MWPAEPKRFITLWPFIGKVCNLSVGGRDWVVRPGGSGPRVEASSPAAALPGLDTSPSPTQALPLRRVWSPVREDALGRGQHGRGGYRGSTFWKPAFRWG